MPDGTFFRINCNCRNTSRPLTPNPFSRARKPARRIPNTCHETIQTNLAFLAAIGRSFLASFYTGAAASTDRTIQINSSNNNNNTGGATITINGSGALTFTAPVFNESYTAGTNTRRLTLGGNDGGTIQGRIQNNTGTTGQVGVTKSGDGTCATGGELFNDDANNDGLKNGLAFLLGATGPDVSALDKLPTASENAGALTLSFQMLDAAARSSATLKLEHSNSLAPASCTTVAVPDTSSTVDDIVFTVTGTGPLNVTATIPASKAANGRLFGRLKTQKNP